MFNGIAIRRCEAPDGGFHFFVSVNFRVAPDIFLSIIQENQ
jgi:hypothetical protein